MVNSNYNGNGKPHILVVDDEPLVRYSLCEFLTLKGFTVSSAGSGKDALQVLKGYNTDIIISDIKMPDIGGMELLKRIKTDYPDLPVVLITGHGTIENAVEAIKEGAYDYVTKPVSDSELMITIGRILERKKLLQENILLKEQLTDSVRERFHDIIGKNRAMQKIYNLIEAISSTRATVLISGESGTGKRLIAHAIHKYNELEREKPFVEVSCGALTETLLESELFGHVKGAFTGAIKDKMGRFELANGGTIFLDEIDAFSPNLQVKLLRVLQEGEFERVGDTHTVKVDVRVIAATNQDIQKLIAEGKFRQDLYYRLNIISIDVPPLRDRKDDIPLLVESFMKKHTIHKSRKITGIANDALSALGQYYWPGNIRELENVIERAIILTKGPQISMEDLPEFIGAANRKLALENNNGLKLRDALKSPERDIIIQALDSVDWSRNEASKLLGINRTTLYKKMSRYGLLKKPKNSARQ